MKTLADLDKAFPTEDSCREYLVQMRWNGTVRCPRCGTDKVHKLARPWSWQCKQCAKQGYRFSPLVGTIFENTNYPLRTWFRVIYLMCQSKKGISALQIHRMIGSGSYRTAWYMCHRIRAAMRDKTFQRLTGVVEVDETFIGGDDRNRHADKKIHAKGGYAHKMAVIGAIARKGNVTAQLIERVDIPTLNAFVTKTVSEKVDLSRPTTTPGIGGSGRLATTMRRSSTIAASTFTGTFTLRTFIASGRCSSAASWELSTRFPALTCRST